LTVSLSRSFPKRGGEGLYAPEPAKIVKAKQLTKLERLLEIELPGGRDLGHKPGQFVQVSVFGFGEAPISVCSSPEKRGSFELCVRNMGGLTAALHRLDEGDTVGIRGPFGNGFPMPCLQKMDCLIVAGGIGMAPLRPVVKTILADRKRYGRLILLYGSRTPDEVLFKDEIQSWHDGDRNQILLTVDRASEGWDGHEGVVTTLFSQITVTPKGVAVALCGPPVMYRFVLAELDAMRVPENQVFLSFERRMKCGMGKCGHCQIDGRCVCTDGPVFSADEAKELRESI
jgi:sulfhydrogenase subunit gamma (sulfur reductase)